MVCGVVYMFRTPQLTQQLPVRRTVIHAASVLAFACTFAFGANVNLSVSGNTSLVSGASFAIIGTGTLSGLGNVVSGLSTAQFTAAGTLSNSTVSSGSSTGPITGSLTLIFQTGDVIVGTFSIPAGILLPYMLYFDDLRRIGSQPTATRMIMVVYRYRVRRKPSIARRRI